jgi:hypothetical protein
MDNSNESNSSRALAPAAAVAESSEAALRAALNTLVLNVPVQSVKPGVRQLKADATAEFAASRRNAVRFALANFSQLADATAGGITAETIKDKIWFGGYGSEGRIALSHLHRHMAEIGHVVGTRKNTSYYSAGSFAMPVTFTEQVYVIDTLDLFKQVLGELTPQAL